MEAIATNLLKRIPDLQLGEKLKKAAAAIGEAVMAPLDHSATAPEQDLTAPAETVDIRQLAKAMKLTPESIAAMRMQHMKDLEYISQRVGELRASIATLDILLKRLAQPAGEKPVSAWP
jgi:hypothetical protein